MARPAATHLQLHLSDRWLPQSAGDVPLRFSRRTGVRFEHGAALLGDLAAADEVTLVLPATRITFVHATLPATRGAASAKVLRYAVEDAVVSAPEEIHAVVMARAPDGEALIAVVERSWLEATLDALDEAGLAPQRVIPESAFAIGPAGPDGEWTVVWAEEGGFLCTDGPETVALDASADGSPPVALRLALHAARKTGAPPPGIRLYTGSGFAAPDAAAWSASLRVPVTAQGRWAPEAQDARRIASENLLTGLRAAGRSESAPLRRFAPALTVASLVLAAHIGLTVFDWTRLAAEEHTLRTDMEARFRAAFPEATKVVDPALQMERNLATLRRAAGEPGPSDALTLMAHAAAPIAASGQRVEGLRYDAGQIDVDLPLAADASTLRALFRSQAPGLAAAAEVDARRAVTVVRIKPEAR